jgi:hypothetical protein
MIGIGNLSFIVFLFSKNTLECAQQHFHQVSTDNTMNEVGMQESHAKGPVDLNSKRPSLMYKYPRDSTQVCVPSEFQVWYQSHQVMMHRSPLGTPSPQSAVLSIKTIGWRMFTICYSEFEVWSWCKSNPYSLGHVVSYKIVGRPWIYKSNQVGITQPNLELHCASGANSSECM